MRRMMSISSFVLAALLVAAPASAQETDESEELAEDVVEDEAAPEEGAAGEAQPGAAEEGPADEGSTEAEPAAEDPADTGGLSNDVVLKETTEPADTDDGPVYTDGGLLDIGLVAGLKFNTGFGEVIDGLGTAFGGELEVGYLLPFADRSLELFASGRYAVTNVEEDGDADDRLPEDGSWSYDLQRTQGIVSLGLLYRLNVGPDWVAPYGAIGGRMYLWKLDATGDSAGNDFGEYEEQATDFGGFGALGADFFVGPGSILFEVQADYAPVDGTVLRDTSAGELGLFLGYRVFL